MLDSNFKSIRKSPLVFLASEALIAEGRGTAKSPVPVDCLNQNLDFFRSHTCRVCSGNQSTHAGAGNRVDRNVMLFHPQQESHVSQAESSTTAEGESDARAGLLGLGKNGQSEEEDGEAAGKGHEARLSNLARLGTEIPHRNAYAFNTYNLTKDAP